MNKQGVIYVEKPIELETYKNEFITLQGSGYPFITIKEVKGLKTYLGNKTIPLTKTDFRLLTLVVEGLFRYYKEIAFTCPHVISVQSSKILQSLHSLNIRKAKSPLRREIWLFCSNIVSPYISVKMLAVA